METGLGAGRGAATDPREEPDERGGETRLIDGGLERGATRFTVGGLGAWRTATGGRETGGRETGALRCMLGRETGALGRGMLAREEGADDWGRPPEDPPPEFR